MTNDESQLTRRKALAGVGAVGFATMGMGRGRPTASWDEYTNYTYAESDTPTRLLVGWRSTYNGDVVADGPPEPVADRPADVRLIDLDNVLPGDAGSASVGLRLEDPGAMTPEGARVWMQIDAELAGPDSEASRALADRITLDVRYDTGVLGVGRCAGAEDEFADFGESIFSGTLGDLTADDGLSSGVALDPGLFDNGCLGPDERRCLTFVWALPLEAGNRGQGGAVDFDVAFRAVSCDRTENPFATDSTGFDSTEPGSTAFDPTDAEVA